MKIPLLFFAVIFSGILLYFSKNIWIHPQTYIEENRNKRAKYSRLWNVVPFNYVKEFLDTHPRFELWYSRFIVLIMYLIFGFGLILILTDSLR